MAPEADAVEPERVDKTKLSRDIDGIAKAMCTEYGQDPQEIVQCDEHATHAPHEMFSYYCTFHDLPIITSQGKIGVRVEDKHARILSCERWRAYRRAAADALVGVARGASLRDDGEMKVARKKKDAAPKPPKSPSLNAGWTVSVPALIIDRDGTGWWVDPSKKTVEFAFTAPPKPAVQPPQPGSIRRA